MLSLPVTPGRATDLSGTPPVSLQERFKHVEIEINTACDTDCFGCDRFSDVTTAPNMTVEQVKLFVDESLDCEWNWERIRILGGEPTLHPQLDKIMRELFRYRRWNSKCFLQLMSNGMGKLEHHRQWLLDAGVDPHVEAKTKGVTPEWFNNTRIVPVDRDPTIGAIEPCGIFGIRGCGIGLSRNGYFLDGTGASIARVAGHDIGIMHLRDVTWEAMIEQSKVLCRICGHWNDPRGGPLVTKPVRETGKVTGAYWTQTLVAWKRHRPVLRIYGES